ncbi:MAG: methionyl-tRNA formyltransferase [Balneolaceae bacterium]
MLRIIYMGSPEFAIPGLEKIHDSGHKVLAVASNPDKRRGRGGGTSPTPVKEKALELGIPVIDVKSTGDPAFADRLHELDPDLLVVVAFRILPPEILEIPRLGAINLHASLLPKYRGAAPIHWAVMNGEKKTGCTVFFLDQDVDTGEIISQVETPIGPNETTGEVYERLKKIGSDLLLNTIDQIEEGNVQTLPQENKRATPAPKLYASDAQLDFSKPAIIVHNKIRGLSPFPTAWTTYKGEKLNIYRSMMGPLIQLQPAELAVWNHQLLAGCSPGTVNLLEVQLPGKNRMKGIDFANGYDLDVRLGQDELK